MKCAFCFYGKPYVAKAADFVINGISVCEEHVDMVSDQGFGRDLAIYHRDTEN
jgi:hypothetical protein